MQPETGGGSRRAGAGGRREQDDLAVEEIEQVGVGRPRDGGCWCRAVHRCCAGWPGSRPRAEVASTGLWSRAGRARGWSCWRRATQRWCACWPSSRPRAEVMARGWWSEGRWRQAAESSPETMDEAEVVTAVGSREKNER